MPRVDEIFNVAYGNKLDMNKMTPVTSGGIAFVGRRGQNQGVSGHVAPIPDIEPYAPGLLTVALGGATLSTFVQQEPFYTAQNVAVLTPVNAGMSLVERQFYAVCIRHNAFRYGAFGREANRTLGTIVLPDGVPDWVAMVPEPSLSNIPWSNFFPTTHMQVRRSESATLRVDELFHLRYGQSLELNRLKRVEEPDGVNFIGRSATNNGVTARVLVPEGVSVGESGELTVALSGSVLSTFVQPEPFITAYHIMILKPNDPSMSFAERFWWARCIQANQYRYSYGRQANRTLAAIKLPAEIPDFVAKVFASLLT
ncbi:hypothetical protein ACI8AC_25095 [Geodermatophilus sp. SYSU D00758]